jgi:hypothetical protein
MSVFGESKPGPVNQAKKVSEQAVKGTMPNKCPIPNIPYTGANVKKGPYQK